MGGSIDLTQLFHIAQKCGVSLDEYKTFIETGTYLGETTARMASLFQKVYTIEVSEALYTQTRAVLSRYPNVVAIFGDSKVVLQSLAKELDPHKPVIYFLDAHFSSGITGKADKDVPLLEELTAIGDRGNHGDIVIIDDFRLFGTKQNEDWSDITTTNVINAISKGETKPKWFILDDRLVIHW